MSNVVEGGLRDAFSTLGISLPTKPNNVQAGPYGTVPVAKVVGPLSPAADKAGNGPTGEQGTTSFPIDNPEPLAPVQ